MLNKTSVNSSVTMGGISFSVWHVYKPEICCRWWGQPNCNSSRYMLARFTYFA